MVPNTARPTRQVSPTTLPRRLRMAAIRCSVRSIPARLSRSNSPTRSGPTVLTRPVFGDTTGVAPSFEPCITSNPLAASIA